MKFPTIFILSIIGSLGFLTSDLPAATIVNWGGDYIPSGTQNLQAGTAANNGATRTNLYSTTGAKSPAAGYTASTGKSGTFYGVFETTNGAGTTAAFSAYRIEDNVSGDRIKVWGQSSTSNGNTVKGLVFFQQSDFLSGSSPDSTVTFDAASSMSLNLNLFSGDVRSVRMAVLSEGVWYLSQTQTSSVSTFTLNNLAAEKWGIWSITDTTAPLNFTPPSYTKPGSTFADIQAVGFYFEATRNAGSARFEADAFSVNAVVTAIPEPATLALIAAPLLVVIFRRKRLSR